MGEGGMVQDLSFQRRRDMCDLLQRLYASAIQGLWHWTSVELISVRVEIGRKTLQDANHNAALQV